MPVIYNDIVDVAGQLDFLATAVAKPALYEQCDILSIHVDMRPGNDNLVGREQLASLKPTAIVINTSRGEALDAKALADAIREKRIAAAAIDVFHPEPPAADFPLFGFARRASHPAPGRPHHHRDGEYELGGARRHRRPGRPARAVPGAAQRMNELFSLIDSIENGLPAESNFTSSSTGRESPVATG